MERARFEESLRKETAALLHGNVQSALAACTVWLTMADELLTSDEESGGIDAAAAAKAAPFIRKARQELERLHKTDVPRAVHMLYPLVIGVGLRPAVESLVTRLAGSQSGCVPAEQPLFAVEVSAGDAFVACDRPTADPSIVHTRLEMYRMLEAMFHLLVESGEAEAVSVLLHLDFDADRLVSEMRVRPEGDGADAIRLSTVLADFDRAVPVERFGRAGGTLERIAASGDVFSLRVSLPLGDVLLGDGGT